jgi:alkylation response protein AidB-like acyl-CoA dehydrogenase
MVTGRIISSDPSTDVVMAAKGLVPLILTAREEGERLRRVPPHVAKTLAAAGLLQLFLPRSMGGPELDPLTVFRAIEEISKADGSIGWCAMIANTVSYTLGWLPRDVGRQFSGQPADFRGAGSLRPLGRAYPVDGGYRVRGHWNFASGIDHANWLFCTCFVMDGEKPYLTEAGTPRIRAMFLPSDQATIKDTWSVVGMRGTGSQDFIVDDVFVPEAHSCFIGEPAVEAGPLYNHRLVFATLFSAVAANSLGIARGAIDAFIELAARESSSAFTAVILRDRPFVQARLAEAEAILNAARAFVVDSVGTLWESACAGASDPTLVIAQARLAIVHAMHESVRSVDLVFHAAGTNAIYCRNPLERYFRDIHVAVQHNSAFPAQYESAGKVLMGLRPTDVGW